MFLENETRGEKMSEYVQYTVPNAEKLKELIASESSEARPHKEPRVE